MKTFLTVSALLSLTLATTGCGDSHAETVHDHVHTPAATYKEGHGLQLSELGAKFADLRIADVSSGPVGAGAHVAAIPAEALLRTVKGDFVFVVNGDWFLRTPVKLGATDGTRWEVAEGLYEGDKIVVSGTKALWVAEVHAVNGGVSCAHGH
jgi:hypothetical protein